MQGKRGKALEDIIEQANRIYKRKGVALVDKVPTPWKVYYDKKRKTVKKAHPEKKGLVDFIGVSHGKAIAFDTKSTTNRTSFPLSNIKEHQVEYLEKHREQGGISFFIIEFTKHDERYFVPIERFMPWWTQMKYGGRKSIPYSWIRFHCPQIKSGHGVYADYLKHCNTVY